MGLRCSRSLTAISLLGRRTPGSDHGGEPSGSGLDELLCERVQTKLEGRISSASSTGHSRNPDLERFPVDNETAIQFRL